MQFGIHFDMHMKVPYKIRVTHEVCGFFELANN